MFDRNIEMELLNAAWVGHRVWTEPNHREVGIVRSIFRSTVFNEWMARVDWDKRNTTAESVIHLELVED